MTAALEISRFAHEHDSTPRPGALTWDQLVEVLRAVRRGACTLATCGTGDHLALDLDGKPKGCRHKYGAAWSPAKYAEGTRRRKQKNVIAVSLLAIDVDHATESVLAEILGKVQLYRFIAHATHGDRADDRCVRIALALSRPVMAAEWPRFWRAAMRALGVPADTQCCDSNRLYFLPSRPSDGEHLFQASSDGDAIDVEAVLATAEPAAAPRPASKWKPTSDERILKRARAYLERMPPAIQGQSGSTALYNAVASMMFGFALDENTTRHLIAEEYNPRCQPPWSERELEHKLTSVRNGCERELGYLRDAPDERTRAQPRAADRGPPPDGDAGADECAEQFRIEVSGKRQGLPSNTKHNVEIALRKLSVRLSYDAFAEQELISGLAGHGPVIDDAAVNRLYLLIEERYHFRPSKDYFYDCIADVCRAASFHPVRDHLDGLTWDGTPRISSWLADYFGAEDTVYTRAVARLVLVAAVRRVRDPGAKFDEMLILESPQGTQKSTGLATLAVNPAWFSDHLELDAKPREQMEQTAGKWIVEAGELKGMSKGDRFALKAYLSRQIDEARGAYGRKVTRRPRQFIVIGTTNEGDDYLGDPTGERRYWPVKVGRVDVERLRADRDQLWGEAAAAEAAGEGIRLDPSLWEIAAVEQEARRATDPVADLLRECLDGHTGKIRALDCYRLAGIDPGKATHDQMGRIGHAMRALGWEKIKRRFGDKGSVQAYVKGTADQRERAIEAQEVFEHGRLGQYRIRPRVGVAA